MIRAVLVIPDSSPLITLAVVDRLDLLLALDLPIFLVDQVFRECTRNPSKPGAAQIRDFASNNSDRVHVAETFVGKAVAESEMAGKRMRQRGLGEAAIAEFLANIDQLVEPGVPVLLLYEDSDVRRISVVAQGSVHLLSTWALLVGLATTGIIESAENIWQAIEAAGRKPTRVFVDQPAPALSEKSDWKPQVRLREDSGRRGF